VNDAPGTLPPSVTASFDVRRLRTRRHLSLFIALSLGLHIGLVAGFLFFPDLSKKPAIDLDNVVKTKLVKLGKERPPDWLPRIDAAPPPPSSTKSHVPKDKPRDEKQDKESKEKPKSAEDVLKNFDHKNESAADIIKKRLGEATDEGMKEGDKDGDALTGEIKKTYFATLTAHIRKHMEVSSTISDEERVRLKAVLSIKIDVDGNVVDVRIDKSSGSTVFDNDVLTAAKRSSPVPAPPPQVQAMVASGVGINFCPSSCS
jgi:TonB family protein